MQYPPPNARFIRMAARNAMASRAPVPAGQLGQKELDGLRDALEWLRLTSKAIAEDRGPSMDSVNREARKHLAAVETCENAFAASGLPWHPEARDRIGMFHVFVKYWRGAAADAAALGLGGDISCAYYGNHIEPPEEVIMAQKWFETAEKVTKAVDLLPFARLAKLSTDGSRHINAVEACRSSWPRARYLSIERRFHKYRLLVEQWSHMAGLMVLAKARENHSDAATIEAITATHNRTRDSIRKAEAMILETKKRRRAIRANMLKKRTCTMCGKTAPNSSPSFAYCGGCHGFRLRECIPRFCSEACQRAHWAAGHKDECPCAKDL